jgi:hypothetical protein
MPKGGEPPDLPPIEPEGCVGPFNFDVDQIPASGNLTYAAGLNVFAPVQIRLDDQGRAAVYADDVLIGWPSRWGPKLENCLQQGYHFDGQVTGRHGQDAFPYLEISVSGQL